MQVWQMEHPVINEAVHLGLYPRVHSGELPCRNQMGFGQQAVWPDLHILGLAVS